MLGRLHPRAKFTESEDQRLKALVRGLGADWDAIAEEMSGRNPRQCRERWMFYLSPDVVNGPWTEAEEALLLDKCDENGHDWRTIAAFFPTRTPINVKNRWNLIQRRTRRRASSRPYLGFWIPISLPASRPAIAPNAPSSAPVTMEETPATADGGTNDQPRQEDDDGLWESMLTTDGGDMGSDFAFPL